jgi:flavodoxin
MHPSGPFWKGVAMKVLLVVLSRHHRNTEKIARVFAEVFDARVKHPRQTDKEELQEFDLIGFGSGIDSDRHYAELLELADSLPRVADRKAFIFSTCGMPVSVTGKKAVAEYAAKSHSALRQTLTSRGYAVIGEFSCAGHNTNSFLKLFGGLNKGRPNAEDLEDAEAFARALKENLESGKLR